MIDKEGFQYHSFMDNLCKYTTVLDSVQNPIADTITVNKSKTK